MLPITELKNFKPGKKVRIAGSNFWVTQLAVRLAGNNIYAADLKLLKAMQGGIQADPQTPGCDLRIVYVSVTPDQGAGGTAVVSATSSRAPMQYSLDGTTWQTSNTFSGLAPGNYLVRVRDAASCTAQRAFTVSTQVTTHQVQVKQLQSPGSTVFTIIRTEQVADSSSFTHSITAPAGNSIFSVTVDGVDQVITDPNVFDVDIPAVTSDMEVVYAFASTVNPLPVSAHIYLVRGDNINSEYTIHHNLNSTNLLIQVVNVDSGETENGITIKRTSANTIKLVFCYEVTDTEQYKILILKV